MRISLECNPRRSFVVQTNHVSIGSFLTDLDKRVVSTSASIQSKAWINLGSRKSATPATTLGGAQKIFDLGIECCRLFQIDSVAGIGADPQARVGKSGFEHQAGFETADILVANGEQYRNGHLGKLIAQIMQ